MRAAPILSVVLAVAAAGACATHPQVTLEKRDDRVVVTVDGAAFTEYLFEREGLRRPVLFPIHGPGGVTLTRSWPLGPRVPGEPEDHPHHDSFWFAHGDVNGIDFWTGRQGARIEHVSLDHVGDGRIEASTRWVGPRGEVVCTDARVIAFSMEGDDRIIDHEITITASHGPVVFGDTKEGTMALRVRPELNVLRAEGGPAATGRYLNAVGDRDAAVWGRPAAWIDLSGTVDGHSVGIACFDHPTNVRHPTCWHARDYGLFAANPFGLHEFTGAPPGSGRLEVAEGKSLTLRHRWLLHAGDAEAARIPERHAAWAREARSGADAAARPADRPNVVIVFVDDLGYGDIGPFGATRQRTPNLDRMAAEGMRLTSFYAAPACSVSRAQLLTGCYGARVGVTGVLFPAAERGLNPAEVTIAERLKASGYETACMGKWHLGDQPDFLPTRQGFDRYLGIPYSNDMQLVSAETGERVVPLLRDERIEELVTDEAQCTIVERLTAEAVGFIEACRDEPFFLYMPHTAVHAPIKPGKDFRGRSGNGAFGDWVEEVDCSMGRILDTLRRLGLDERTLVIFTSDNGPWTSVVGDATSSGPLRGSKGSTWEGGVRVPTLARWPGRIAAGTSCDAVAGTIDLLPTIVTLADGAVPAEPVIDGRDIGPLLFGTSRKSPREAHFYFRGDELQAVRKGPWKLAVAPQPAGMGATDGRAAVPASFDRPRLYNLDADIGERTDVAADHPEVVASLEALAAAMTEQLGDPRSPARRPAGRVADPRTLYPTRPEKPR